MGFFRGNINIFFIWVYAKKKQFMAAHQEAKKAVFNFLRDLGDCHPEYKGVCNTFKRDDLGHLKKDDLAKWCKLVVKRIKESGIVSANGSITFDHAKNIIKDDLVSFRNILPRSNLNFCHIWKISNDDVRESICAHLNKIYGKLTGVECPVDPHVENVKQMVLGDKINDKETKVFSDLIEEITGNFGEKEPTDRDLKEITSTIESKFASGDLDIMKLLSMANMVTDAVKKSGHDTTGMIPGMPNVDVTKMLSDYMADPEQMARDQEEMIKKAQSMGPD